MYIILTSKIDEYNANPQEGVMPVEAYDYYFYDKKKAGFTIAEISENSSRVNIVECGDGGQVNSVPIKFFEKFETMEEARRELEQLVTFGTIDARLEKVSSH